MAADLYGAAKRLLDSIAISGDGLRLLGLRAEHVVDPREGIQLAFGSDPRRERAEAALDRVRDKFGSSSAGPGSLIDPGRAKAALGKANKSADEAGGQPCGEPGPAGSEQGPVGGGRGVEMEAREALRWRRERR